MNAIKKIIWSLSILLLGAGCSSNTRISALSDGNDYLASVLKTGGENGLFYLTDYLPALDGVDSISAADGFRAIPSSDRWQMFEVETEGSDAILSHISVWKNGKALSLAVNNSRQSDLSAQVPHLYTKSNDNKTISIGFTERPTKVVALWQNTLLDERFVSVGDEITITIPRNAVKSKHSFIRVYAATDKQAFSDVLIPLKKGKVLTSAEQLDRHDQHGQIIYSLMIDRFNNGNPDNDWRIDSPDVLPIVDYMGGDIKGITQKIEDGYFNELGINTIWVSPITQNPYDAWGLNLDPYTKFSGYHGYWPLYITQLDKRFGTEAELEEMLAAAHKHGINVILDYVANHMHIDSPVLTANPDWVTQLELPDGRQNIGLWDEYRLTTWFDTHIPTLDLERIEIYEPLTDSALYWLEHFDFDGFRHDATKHIPEDYWRTLTAKMKQRFPGRVLYQIGETYGSPQLIGSYVKSGMLDAQFDFNLYDRSIWHIADANGDMNEIAKVVNESLNYYGYHNLMGNITGNHDRPRFISLAGGSLKFDEDHKAAGWKRDVTVGDPVSYSKLELLHALIMTLPGIPCIYQGDEYGVPGGNDPDNRHMMQFDDLKDREEDTLDNLKELTSLRHNSLPLIYGDLIPLYSDRDTYAFTRIYMGEPVLVVFNRGDKIQSVTVSSPDGIEFSGLMPKFNSGTIADNESNSYTIDIAPISFEVFTL